MELAVSNHGREGLLLNGSGAQIDAVENRSVQNVEASVDTVADEFNGLLDESVDARRVGGLVDDDTILGGLFDLGDADGTLIAVRLVESGQLLEGVFAGDIGVQDEERGVVFAEDVGSQLQRTGSAQGLRLNGERDLNAEFLLVLYSVMVSAVELTNQGLCSVCWWDRDGHRWAIICNVRTSFKCVSIISGR